MSITQEIGSAGEKAAAEYLTARGFDIIARNWRKGRYEIDIIAVKNGEIHFVEVKSRKAGGLTSPEEAMDRAKCSALLKAANLYIEDNEVDRDCRIDLIAIDMHGDGTTAIRFIPDAVAMSW